jgi:LPXTG-motif cell wall-anchored protein
VLNAPPAPAAEAAPEPSRTAADRNDVGDWVLLAAGIVVLIGVIALAARRRREERLSIFDAGTSSRPGSPLAQRF